MEIQCCLQAILKAVLCLSEKYWKLAVGILSWLAPGETRVGRKEGLLPPKLGGLPALVITVPFLLCPPQYALYKKMTQAAILIQSKFRSYYEQKRFQQSRRAAVLIQNFYRSYKKCGRRRPARRTAVIVQQKLRWVESLLGLTEDLPGTVARPASAGPEAWQHLPLSRV